MLRDTEMALVRQLPLFSKLTPEFLGHILEGSVPRDVGKGVVLFHRDDPADCFYIVLDGWIKVFRETAEGDEAVLGASMSKHLHGFVVDVEQLKTSSATQRVVEFLLRLCSVDEGSAVVVLPYDKTLISRRLGMQPESLSRILAKLRKQGVRTEQNRVVISDVSALHDYCHIDPLDFHASVSC